MKITMIPTTKIYTHPFNRRTDLGDLAEMVGSMKTMGVLEPIIVVPYSPIDHAALVITDGDGSDCYVAVAGNRRRAAAEQAKITEMPCIVSDMDIKEQNKVMLIENLQREGLTPYQEAQGIQMMLDMGETVESIAKETGFSKSKVEKRVKLAVFDKDKFAESESRNVSMNDYLKLAKLEDPDLRNQLLSSIGTANFENELARAKNTIKNRATRAEQIKVVESFAKKVNQAGDDFARINTIYSNEKAEDIKVPADADTREYFFTEESWAITIYRRKTEGEITAEEDKEKESAKLKADFLQLEEVSARSFELRVNFMRALTSGQAKKCFAVIASHLADYIRELSFKQWMTLRIDHHLAGDLLGVSVDEKKGVNADEVKEVATKWPERTLLTLIYLQLEDNKLSYAKQDWKDGRYIPIYKDSEDLSRIYALLTDIGYQMSEEEKQMQDGTHPLFYKEPEKQAKKAEAEEPAEKAAA